MSAEPLPVGTLLREATKALAATSDSARLDAELLLAHVLGCSRSTLHVRADDRVDDPARASFDALVRRRTDREPVAYLVGQRGFWTFDLDVTPDVLVPRPETERLVAWALDLAPGSGEGMRMLDLGTGSGAIALALAHERPHATVIATDRSRAALSIARANAARLCPDRIAFVEGRWYEALPPDASPFELIVSNPPYVAERDPHLASLAYEPRIALAAGPDGLADLRVIVAGAPSRLERGGWLLVEHGYDQGVAVRSLLANAGFVDVETRRDFGGQERVTGGRRP
ncbi:MAG TPA: peptide chain release factor N(5)-glutamine methyltransferase [Nevskiaceae bacterium]|nr:peptide chain release factor N(5)-glutamine methyltransferase [Nevskiaceae bacterium]